MKRANVLANAHFAARVQRYHTWPMHHQQSVGEHTLQILRIWWQMWGPMLPKISTCIIWHDLGELVGGDPPYPVKARNPDLKAGHDRVENQAIQNMGGPVNGSGGLDGFNSYDLLMVKICDNLEMWETGLVELRMGNQFATPIVEDLEVVISEQMRGLSHQHAQAVAEFILKVKELLTHAYNRGA